MRQFSGLAAANTSIKSSSRIVSSAYATDGWGVGAGYFDGHREDPLNVAGKDEHNKWIVEGKYGLGPGVTFVGALSELDLDADGTATQAATGVGNGTDNDGWGAIAGRQSECPLWVTSGRLKTAFQRSALSPKADSISA